MHGKNAMRYFSRSVILNHSKATVQGLKNDLICINRYNYLLIPYTVISKKEKYDINKKNFN